ncbi:MAG TPA: caspase family protein [Pyrinomonadaceae bacterium]
MGIKHPTKTVVRGSSTRGVVRALALCALLLSQTVPASRATTRHGGSAVQAVRAMKVRPDAPAAAAPAKYAMLVGINKYPGNPLSGCVNDVKKLREMLVKDFGFPAENVLLLTDEQATRANILGKLDEFASKLKRDDLFVFAYSGHGTLFPDSYSEEKDETETLHFAPDPRNNNQPFFEDGKYDAAVCPVDSRESSSGKPWRNLILDDELYARFSKATAAGAFVNYLTDSCFSGTQGRDLFKTRSMKLADAIGVPLSQLARPTTQRRAAPRDMGGRYLVLSSSSSLQPSTEWRDDEGNACGLFSYVFQKLVKLQNGKITYKELYEKSEYVIKRLSRDNQEPQMDTRFYTDSLDRQVFAVPGEAVATHTSAPAPASPTGTGAAGTAQDSTAAAATPAPAAAPGGGTGAAASPEPLRVLVLVTNDAGKLLDKCSFAIFKPGVVPVKGEIKREDILLLGRTNESGYFDSAEKGTNLQSGTYPVKIVREGYQSFVSTLEVRQGSVVGYAVLAVRLKAE